MATIVMKLPTIVMMPLDIRNLKSSRGEWLRRCYRGAADRGEAVLVVVA